MILVRAVLMMFLGAFVGLLWTEVTVVMVVVMGQNGAFAVSCK